MPSPKIFHSIFGAKISPGQILTKISASDDWKTLTPKGVRHGKEEDTINGAPMEMAGSIPGRTVTPVRRQGPFMGELLYPSGSKDISWG